VQLEIRVKGSDKLHSQHPKKWRHEEGSSIARVFIERIDSIDLHGDCLKQVSGYH
jgi:hypothetical protein